MLCFFDSRLLAMKADQLGDRLGALDGSLARRKRFSAASRRRLTPRRTATTRHSIGIPARRAPVTR
jgi:hypothetical protein